MSNRKLITIGLIAVACLGLAVIGRLLLSNGNARNSTDAPSEMVAALQTHFPDDWKAMQQQRQQASGNDAAIGAAFINAKVAHVARAPDSAILAIIAAETALAKQLQHDDPAACANYILAGPTDTHRYSQPAQVLLDRAAAQTVIAARQGIDAPKPRTVNQPAAIDRLQFAMRDQGVPSRLMDPDAARPLTADEQCQYGVHLYETLGTLPPAQAADIFVNLKFAQP